jgi:glutamyl-Q tRNA(Asp) synthetase
MPPLPVSPQGPELAHAGAHPPAPQPRRPYIGRFAPSPSGPLHAGSIATALASWLDARAHGGRWLLRIEDIDPPRTQEGAAQTIVQTLQQLGLHWDGPISRQSQHEVRFKRALDDLVARQQAYPCACSRRAIAAQLAQAGRTRAADQDLFYPGTCRTGLPKGCPARAWRLRVPNQSIAFVDRHCGPFEHNVAQVVGDFVLRRADGLWAYQLAVVVDDAAEGVTDIVRGADLLDSTPRQMVLARALGHGFPRTLHTPLVHGPDGHKLSKHQGAPAALYDNPIATLGQALRHLGFEPPTETKLEPWLHEAIRRWAQRHAFIGSARASD